MVYHHILISERLITMIAYTWHFIQCIIYLNCSLKYHMINFNEINNTHVLFSLFIH
jgi:hypothetical protein